ncbi:Rgg/GadR/MutR family transcriptional regulator [Carnobacterium sp. CS13]|uniref:helix-turn-helix domain-containing protein n=1 Tax=Carnobacterium sp. CS13 TaxID=2800128 RepID=UPI001911D74F|nr:Rgg/GadR/MutR family transcriptional regulator [Carnobacterium sp. CS13]QQP70790.1 Rgg/GadR/MutR family transcriptional regulator [Carnobacterium sp. CS13]
MPDNTKPFGYDLKKIRENKGYTQEIVAQNAMSRSTYTRFETEAITTTVTKYLKILNNLDMTHKEFSYIRNGYHLDEKEAILYHFNSVATNSDNTLLQQLKKRAEVYLLENNDHVIKDIVEICQALLTLSQTHDLKLAYTHAEKVWERLSKLDKWYLTELRLLNNILFLFPPETSLFISKRALIDLDHYRHFEEATKLKMAFSMNLVYLLMEDGDFTQSLFYADPLIEESKKETKYIMLAVLYVRKGIILEKLESEKDAQFFIQKGFTILEAIEEWNIKKELEQELNYYLHPDKKNKLPR